MDVNGIQQEYLDWAKRMNWNVSQVDWQQILNHLHCEVSEAWEELRQGRKPDEIYWENGKLKGFPIEMADVVLIVLGSFARAGLDIEEAVKQKHAFNITRESKKPNV